MKRFLLLTSVFLLFGVTSCTGSKTGPQVWIDQPLEENNPVNEGPLILQAHASDADGISDIVFTINGVEVNKVTTSGERFGRAAIEWTPPGPGTFIVHARASNLSGVMGAAAQVKVVVRGEDEAPGAEDEVPTRTVKLPTAEVVFTPSLSPSISPSLTPIPNTVTPSPLPTTPPSVTPRRDTHTPVPSPSITPTITPTADTVPPAIFTLVLSPGEITVDSSGCSGEPRTSSSTLSIYDAGGIAEVKATWSISNLSGTVFYSTADGTTYTGTFGPVSIHGTMEINGSVIDHAGNMTPFVHSLVVNPCID